MAQFVGVDNLIAYSLQMALLAGAGTIFAYLFRLRVPRVSILYWQILLLVCLLVPALQNWRHPVQFQRPAILDTVVYEIPKEVLAIEAKPSFSITPAIIGLAIATGACLRMTWLAFGYFRLRRFIRHSQFLSAIPPVGESMASRIRVHARFFLSKEICSPATFGIFAPTVILPMSFAGMSGACREAVVCHELLHVRRRDWAVILIEEIVRSIYWFHPAVWWLLSRIHLAREQSVDHEVVQLTGNRQAYLDSLLEIARSHGRPRAVPATLFLKERHLVQRVALLIKEGSMNRFRLTVSLAGIAVLLAVTVRLAAAWFPLTGEPEIVQQQDAKTENLLPVPNAIKSSIPAIPASETSKTEIAPKTRVAALLPPEPVTAENLVSTAETVTVPVAAPQREPIRVGGAIQESKLIRKVEPIYPELALKARVSGKVTLTVTVDEQGFVSDVRVLMGHPLLNEAAIAAVRQWQYSPTLLNGVPVPVLATVTVVFALDGNNAETGSGSNAPSLPFSQPVRGKFVMAGLDWLIGFTATPIDEKGLPYAITEGFRAPELSTTPDIFLKCQRIAEAEWPADVSKGTPLTYSFVITEAGQFTSFTRVRGPEIPDLERELSQVRANSSGFQGSAPVRSLCIIEFRVGLSSDEKQNLLRSFSNP